MHANEGGQTETLFHTYSQFGSTPNIPAKPSEEELRVETRLNEVLEQVQLGGLLVRMSAR